MRAPLTVLEETDWLLLRAFPEPLGANLPSSPATRRFLNAIAENEALWTGGDTGYWLNRVGLPAERAALRQLTERR
jgi:hypothetical protein